MTRSMSRSCQRHSMPSVPSSSSPFRLPPISTLALLLVCLLAQQRSTADGFLLAHRNLLKPFASSKGIPLSSVQNRDPENAVSSIALIDEDVEQYPDEEEKPSKLEEKPKMPMRLLGFMALPKSAMASIRRQIEGVPMPMPSQQEEDEENDGTGNGLRARRKRMHHLSILRKVGAPNGQMLVGSRLFGPQKHTRELKRTVPLFLVEY